MFDNNELEDFMKKSNEQMPDGVIDASSYVKVFSDISRSLIGSDPGNEISRMGFMASVMSHIDDSSYEEMMVSCAEVVGTLCFHILTLMSIGIHLDEDFMVKYSDLINNNAIPNVEADNGIIPYWN